MAASDVESLSTIECLILAQAVYEYGADAWHSVSQTLANHPAIARPKSFFAPQSCHQMYTRLMNEAALECSETNNAPHAPLNLNLAQRHYSARLLHLRDLIAVEEARFKSLVAEIDEIRSGAWDDKIKAKLVSSNSNVISNDVPADSHLPIEPPPEPQPQSATSDLPLVDDQETLIQKPDDGTQLIVDNTTQQPSATTTSDTIVENQIAETIPITEDAVHEPATMDITDISKLTPVDISEPSKPVPETTEIDVEESAIPQEADQKTSAKSQQREGKRKVGDLENLDDSLREKKRARDDSILTDADEQACSSRQRSTVELAPHQQIPPSVPNKRFQTVIGMLHSQISQHRNGNIFHNPIKNSEAPDYHDIIKRPMDLKTIKARVKDGIISNSLEFQRDVYLMFANAMMYNRPGSDIYHMAEEMMLESEGHINTFRQTEGFIRSNRS